MRTIHPEKKQGEYHIKRQGQIKSFLRSALICMLCLCLVGCGILGDGEITIVTAPPIVTPKVSSYDNYGEGEITRFDINGTDAFYLLPGIENYPDYMQDFICMDYTSSGYFIYYYCAPSYISAEEIEALKDGEEHTAPNGPYPEIDRNIETGLDAMIVMAFNPATRKYKVLDAQAYSNNKVKPGEEKSDSDNPSATANTGVEFYKSSDYEFNMLSHCYGCKVSGSSEYFIFDQKGGNYLYNDEMELIAYTNVGGLLDFKVHELEANIKENYDDDDDISEVISDLDNNKTDRGEMTDAMSELANATKKSYSGGNTKVKDIKLHYLIKSAVMDGTGKIFMSLMIYTGESPWSSELLINRVCCITSFTLDSDHFKIVSENENFEEQAKYYQEYATKGLTYQDARNGYTGFRYKSGKALINTDALDSFTPFYGKKLGENFFVMGTNEEYSFIDLLTSGHFWEYLFTYRGKAWMSLDDPDFVYYFMDFLLSRYNKKIRGTTPKERLKGIQEELIDMSLLPRMRSNFNEGKNMHECDFPDNPDAGNYQSLYFMNVYLDDGIYGRDTYKMPKLYAIQNAEGTAHSSAKVYYAPDEYNPEIPVYIAAYDYIADEEKAQEIMDRAVEDLKKSLIYFPGDKIREILTEYATANSISDGMFAEIAHKYPDMKLNLDSLDYLEEDGYNEDVIFHAFKGEAPIQGTVHVVKSEKLTIKAGTFPISYKLVFPYGSYVSSADLDEAEGSSNTSMLEGALLFFDEAQASVGAKSTYTSGIRYERETGKVFEDSKVEGSAIDTGTLNTYDSVAERSFDTLMLITQTGVKFYFPLINMKSKSQGNIDINSISYSGDEKYSCYIENEKLLSSTGFTPYTEAASQAAVTTRIDKQESIAEKYQDNKNKAQVSQLDLTLSLNSSRAGTIQSASSFTQISDKEILISAYDTGLSLLRLLDTTNINYEVLHLQNGSFYQSFLDKNTNMYKILGFDTEDFVYGSMDLARAKVYDFNFEYERNTILENALIAQLDQMAIDYIRRLHRTRTIIDEDSEGNALTTINKVEILPFEDDHSEEAESERILFEGSKEAAGNELSRMAKNNGLTYLDEVNDYLVILRERVEKQKLALEEIFVLTKAKKLGAVLDSDPYWVGLKERLQYTTELGDFKDILAEIVTEPAMISLLGKADADTYYKFRETLNYKDEELKRNQVLANVNLPAEELEELLENRKTVKDYEEQYSDLSRGKDKETDPLQEKLNTDGIMSDPDSKEDTLDRMEIRQLILEDIENYYFEANPLEEEKVYAPDGSYVSMVTKEREDAVWEEYLDDLLSRINPLNLSAARNLAVEKFAELSYTASRTMENGVATDNALTVSKDIQDKMKTSIVDNVGNCETIADVEALFFGTQIKNLGNPYGKYVDDYDKWERDTKDSTDSEKAKLMRSSEWYQKLKELLLNSKELEKVLSGRNQSWEAYIQAVFTGKTGSVLRDDQTGETAGAHTSAASTFAQLVEFICEGQDVSLETKKDMVEDLLIGLETLNGAETVEEAVMIEKMTLPSYQHFMSDYEAFNKKTFDTDYDDQQADDQKSGTNKPVTFVSSYEGTIRRKELLEQEFYKQTIGTMKESELVKAYLDESGQTWELYMAGLPALAGNENITDPAASAQKIYEDFEPYKPVDESLRPKASDGSEERPIAYSDGG